MKTIVVTGCAGFIGWKVAEQLIGNDYSVIGIDNANDYYDPQLKEWRLKNISEKMRLQPRLISRNQKRNLTGNPLSQ